MKRSLLALALALSAGVAGSVMVPSAAQAAPPFDCRTRISYTSDWVQAWCNYGTGRYRALALCEAWWGERKWFSGPWIHVQQSSNSMFWCSGEFNSVVDADYETIPY
jgi:hypothetical protein